MDQLAPTDCVKTELRGHLTSAMRLHHCASERFAKFADKFGVDVSEDGDTD